MTKRMFSQAQVIIRVLSYKRVVQRITTGAHEIVEDIGNLKNFRKFNLLILLSISYNVGAEVWLEKRL